MKKTNQSSTPTNFGHFQTSKRSDPRKTRQLTPQARRTATWRRFYHSWARTRYDRGMTTKKTCSLWLWCLAFTPPSKAKTQISPFWTPWPDQLSSFRYLLKYLDLSSFCLQGIKESEICSVFIEIRVWNADEKDQFDVGRNLKVNSGKDTNFILNFSESRGLWNWEEVEE